MSEVEDFAQSTGLCVEAVGHWRTTEVPEHVGALLPRCQCYCVSTLIPTHQKLMASNHGLGWR